MRLSDFLRDAGRTVAYSPAIARLTGVKECVFLCQLIYWHDKGEDGWVYKTRDQIEEETGLSHEEQANARKRLKQLGLLDERHARLQHRVYYRANLSALNDLWEQRPKPQTTVSGNRESLLPEEGNDGVGTPPNAVSSVKREITAESTAGDCAARAPRPRNALFDTLCEIEGSNPLEIGRKGGRIAGALRQIKEATPDVTPDEIKRRAANYRETWPTITLTATALATHWAKFGWAETAPLALTGTLSPMR